MNKIHVKLHTEYDISMEEVEQYRKIFDCKSDDEVVGVIKALTTKMFEEYCESDEMKGRNAIYDLYVEAM